MWNFQDSSTYDLSGGISRCNLRLTVQPFTYLERLLLTPRYR